MADNQFGSNSNHDALRSLLRVVGPLVVIVGAGFTISGMVSFFGAFTSEEPPLGFWRAFVGLPLIGIGAGICTFAYAGAVARYQAEEIAPVAKDTFNYMAEGTQEGVRTVARAIHDGISGDDACVVRCPKCGRENEEDAQFCNQCGEPLGHTCPSCGKKNGSDAKFCNGCGHAIG